jgi:hypothetical protein
MLELFRICLNRGAHHQQTRHPRAGGNPEKQAYNRLNLMSLFFYGKGREWGRPGKEK